MLSSIIETKPPFKEIKRDITFNKLSHAYIIIAQDEEVGREFFKLVCREVFYKYGYTDKETTEYKLRLNIHPNVSIYDSRDKITVKTGEDFVLDVYNKGMEADYKLYLFDSTTKALDPRVQNKMLKVFEEPPKDITTFILTKSESTLLPTINSRAKKIYLNNLENEEIIALLLDMGIEKEKAIKATAFSLNSISLATLLAQDSSYFDYLEECIRVLTQCRHSSQVAGFLDSIIFKKENIVQALSFFEVILNDKMREISQKKTQKEGYNDWYNLSQIEGFSLSSLAISIDYIAEAKKQLDSNINALSVAETLLLKILEAKYKWQ